MESTKFEYSLSFKRTLTEHGIGQLFKTYKKEPVLAVLLREARIDVLTVPGRKRVVLEKLVTKLFQEAMLWSEDCRWTEESLTVLKLSSVFEGVNVYQNLSKIFERNQSGELDEADDDFVVYANEEGFKNADSMVEFFVKKELLKKVENEDPKKGISLTLVEHCAHSKRKQISLKGCAQDVVPRFTHSAEVTHLDLEWNSLQTADLAAYTQLTVLNLAHNKLTNVPSSLPDSLAKLNLSGNPITQLDFKSLPPNLSYLDISYMSQMTIPETFWKLLDGRVLALRFSSDMKLQLPKDVDLSKISFEDQFGNEGIIHKGTVVFSEPEEEEILHERTSSSASFVSSLPLKRNSHLSQSLDEEDAPKSATNAKRSTDPEDEENASGGFMKAAIGWCKIAAIVAAFGYICMKLWPLYKRA